MIFGDPPPRSPTISGRNINQRRLGKLNCAPPPKQDQARTPMVAMLANTYWFLQTSKKGFQYDCSCESCPCSFSFFSSYAPYNQNLINAEVENRDHCLTFSIAKFALNLRVHFNITHDKTGLRRFTRGSQAHSQYFFTKQ